MYLNNVVVEGNLVSDPEVRQTQGGASVTNVSVALNKRWTTKDGEKREQAHFFDVEAWGKTGEILAEHGRKGLGIIIFGELKQDRWETKEGSNRSKVKISARLVRVLPKREEERDERPPADDVPF